MSRAQLPPLSDSLLRLNKNADPAPHSADAHGRWPQSSLQVECGSGGDVGARGKSGLPSFSFLSPALEPAAHQGLQTKSSEDSSRGGRGGGGGEGCRFESLAAAAAAAAAFHAQQGPGAGAKRCAAGGEDWGAGAGGAAWMEALVNHQDHKESGLEAGQKRARVSSEGGRTLSTCSASAT